MKLRMRSNSIRLRLTQSEVGQLAKNGIVEETIDFGSAFGGRFIYSLQIDRDRQDVYSTSGSGRINVHVPRTLAENWIQTEEVGIEGLQPTDSGRSLRLIIEKDFTCLHPRPGEDRSDAFPNPSAEK
ncbi:MAG: hypothetical protein ABI999_18015 [Acidobacteriota bacterium]